MTVAEVLGEVGLSNLRTMLDAIAHEAGFLDYSAVQAYTASTPWSQGPNKPGRGRRGGPPARS